MKRQAFTLTELLIVMMILGIMVGLALAGLAGAIDLAREQRTRAIVSKIDSLIAEKQEEYRTRSVPVRSNLALGPYGAAVTRLYGLRELMRMELPDRVTDVTDNPVVLSLGQAPSAWKSYRRTALRCCGANWATGAWTEQFQGSECLYLILSLMHDGDKAATDYFLSGEVGDTDGDGMKEILDGWGQPIEFLRWAPAFTKDEPPLFSVSAALTEQTAYFTVDPTTGKPVYSAPDPFDPAKADPRWLPSIKSTTPWGFALRPLIFSAGRDKKYDIATQLATANGGAFHYAATVAPNGSAMPNDPYYVPTAAGQKPLGTQFDADGDGFLGFIDNITNHYQVTP